MTDLLDDDLDDTTFPAWRERTAAHQPDDAPPRSYPGYPRFALPRAKPGLFAMSLARALAARRSAIELAPALPTAATLGAIVDLAHGVTGADGRGPVPSAGGLHAVELYLVHWTNGAWLPAGWYHVDRGAHALAQIVEHAARAEVARIVPSLAVFGGGALVWIAVGDRARVAARYSSRADRFLLVEAGHLMQNLCLASVSCGHQTVPFGGFFGRAIARTLQLPRTDRVLYAGVLGGRSA